MPRTSQEFIMIRHLIAAALAVFALNAFAAVDANQANQADLESIKGIGPGLSARIINKRQSGAFKNWADMVERVPGVGEGNAARFSQAGLTVAGASYSAAPKAARPVHAVKAAKAPKAAAAAPAHP
jgi:competence protein ComEA